MANIPLLSYAVLTPASIALGLLCSVGQGLFAAMAPPKHFYVCIRSNFLLQVCLYWIIWTIYSLFFHPLSAYPGPKIWALSRLPWILTSLRGDIAWKIRDFHEQYGPVIRIAPDELSYTTGTAWKKIYGQRNPEFVKCLDGRGIVPPSRMGVRGIATAHQEKHAQLRRAILPAFSERALREQESFFQLYAGKLTAQLRRACKSGPQDMVRWYSFTAFDIVSDLAFGEAAGCLGRSAHRSFLLSLCVCLYVTPWREG